MIKTINAPGGRIDGMIKRLQDLVDGKISQEDEDALREELRILSNDELDAFDEFIDILEDGGFDMLKGII